MLKGNSLRPGIGRAGATYTAFVKTNYMRVNLLESTWCSLLQALTDEDLLVLEINARETARFHRDGSQVSADHNKMMMKLQLKTSNIYSATYLYDNPALFVEILLIVFPLHLPKQLTRKKSNV